MSQSFLISWCCEGLECVVPIEDPEKEAVWCALNGTTPTNDSAKKIFHITMRARANTQRHYEVYAITVEDGITQEDLVNLFEESPQSAADLIRDRGVVVYSDRMKDNHIKIR